MSRNYIGRTVRAETLPRAEGRNHHDAEAVFMKMANDIYKLAVGLHNNSEPPDRVYFINRMKVIARHPDSDREALDYLGALLTGLPWP